MNSKRFIHPNDINSILKNKIKELNITEIAVVQNPSYIFFPIELYPMAPKINFLDELKAVVMDMDGTTTTTEPLCLHSLEYMVREITGYYTKNEWKGLDRKKDYPNVIGNSTTKHVEYLIKTYYEWIDYELLIKAYIKAILWTLIEGEDQTRKEEVISNINVFFKKNIFTNNEMVSKLKKTDLTDSLIMEFYKKWKNEFSFKDNFENIVRAAIDIYYARYHFILKEISSGLHREEKLIQPMPGVAIYLALISGMLGEEADKVYENFIKELKKRTTKIDYSIISDKKLKKLGIYFEQNQVKIGIVTSSIFYEADIVLTEIFRLLREEVKEWNISDKRKDFILNKFTSYKDFYNTVITASDSSEIRLKPHRDLYAIALHKLGIQPDNFNKVVGFEDSESGTIAIRSAGIGLCVAVPFSDTHFHNFDAASKVVYGGLPETILRYSHWIDI